MCALFCAETAVFTMDDKIHSLEVTSNLEIMKVLSEKRQSTIVVDLETFDSMADYLYSGGTKSTDLISPRGKNRVFSTTTLDRYKAIKAIVSAKLPRKMRQALDLKGKQSTERAAEKRYAIQQLGGRLSDIKTQLVYREHLHTAQLEKQVVDQVKSIDTFHKEVDRRLKATKKLIQEIERLNRDAYL